MSASGVLDSPIANRGCDCRSITTQLRPSRVRTSDMRLPAKPEPMMATSECMENSFQFSVLSFQCSGRCRGFRAAIVAGYSFDEGDLFAGGHTPNRNRVFRDPK